MGMQVHGRVSFSRALPMAGVQEERQADKQEQENMEMEDHWSEEEEWSPDKNDAEEVEIVEKRTESTRVQNHNPDRDHDAITTIHTTVITTTSTPTRKGSSSRPAANTQGLKDASSVSSAVPCQAYKSGDLRRETESPIR